MQDRETPWTVSGSAARLRVCTLGFGGDGLFWIILPEIKDPDERVYLRF